MDSLNTWLSTHFASLGWTAEAAVRLLIAALLGGLVGIEREIRGRQAGFRTNLLVALGSALVMLVSVNFAHVPWPDLPGYVVNVDPGRIAYGVMTGIGFLGAGAIIKQGTDVRGLTTAAGLWCVAGVGLATGLGLYVLAGAATLVILMALWGLDLVERVIPTRHYRVLVIRCRWCPTCITDLLQTIRGHGLEATELGYDRAADLVDVDISLSISYTSRRGYVKFQEHLHADPTLTVVSSRSV